MKKAATIIAILTGLLMAIGINPKDITACAYVLLVLYSVGRTILTKQKDSIADFIICTLILLIAPSFLCQLILHIGWPYIIGALIISAIIYIYLNIDTGGDGNPKTSGGERTSLNDSHVNESDFDDSEFNKYSWDDREVN